MMTIGSRLRWARKRAGFKSAKALRQRYGWTESTFLSHENGQTETPPVEELVKYAETFDVDLRWLITGRGEPETGRPSTFVAIDGVVGAGPAVSLVSDEQAAALGEIPMPGDGHLGGLIVEGDSQQPRWRRGEVIVYDRRSTPPEDLVGCYAVVVTADGDSLVKIIRRGVGMNRWRLDSHNADPVENVFLIGAHRVVATIHRHPASLEDELPAPVLPQARRGRAR